jgi:hypothetical protein
MTDTLYEDLHRYVWLVFVMETDCVLCEVRPEVEEIFNELNVSQIVRQVQRTWQTLEMQNIAVYERSTINTISRLLRNKYKNYGNARKAGKRVDDQNISLHAPPPQEKN